jgi:hypothetical protein
MSSNGIIIFQSVAIIVLVTVIVVITVILLDRRCTKTTTSASSNSSSVFSEIVPSSSSNDYTIGSDWPLDGLSFALKNKYADCIAANSYLMASSSGLSLGASQVGWTFTKNQYVAGSYFIQQVSDSKYLSDTGETATQDNTWFCYYSGGYWLLSFNYSNELLAYNQTASTVGAMTTDNINVLSQAKWKLETLAPI